MCTYCGETISFVGMVGVTVKYKEQGFKLTSTCANGVTETGQSLFGRNWLQAIKLHWYEIEFLQNTDILSVVEKCNAVFGKGLGYSMRI